MKMKKRKLFCEYGIIPYKISVVKEAVKKDIKDLFAKQKIAKRKKKENLNYILKGDAKILLRKLEGVDMQLQKNKVTNLEIAAKKIDGIIINPNEVFSFWKLVGNPVRAKGYLKGLMIGAGGKLTSGYGGGLCQLANLIHYLVLHTPMEVVELHHHSDALFPDYKRRVPFGTGTSIAYKSVDYRFKNTLDCPVQLRVWLDDKMLYGELRANKELQYKYKLVEQNHHYVKEKDGIYYRNSEVYKIIMDKKTKSEIDKELVLKNHSRVMYDYSLIPAEEILERK
jgi:vancomycin resistance protein VanW